ncbi:hypothetical protein V6N13_009201 [Hibiscus sabdariffa]
MLSIFSLGFSLEIPSCRYRLALLVESLLVIGGTCDCRPTNHYLSGYCHWSSLLHSPSKFNARFLFGPYVESVFLHD